MRRHPSGGTLERPIRDLEWALRPCVRGLVCHTDWVPLPVKAIDGRHGVPIGQRHPWLVKIVCGRTYDLQVVAWSLVTELHQCLCNAYYQARPGTRRASGADIVRKVVAQSADDVEGKPTNPDVCMDSGGEIVSELDAPAGNGWLPIEIYGIRTNVICLYKRLAYIQLNKVTLAKLLKHIHTTLKARPSPVRIPRPREARVEKAEKRDCGRVHYLASKRSYRVSFVDTASPVPKRRTSMVGLAVQPLDAETFEGAKSRALQLARQTWNRMDRSERPRYAEEDLQ